MIQSNEQDYYMYMISDDQAQLFTHFTAEVTVRPHEQIRIPLGNFTKLNPPKGFSVIVDPDPDPAESIVTQTIRIDKGKSYQLMLHIANYGNKTVRAEIWQM